MDRIDLKVEVPRPRDAELLGAIEGESSLAVRARQGKPNARLQAKETAQHCALDGAAERLLKEAIAKLSLSARAYHRVLRVARSIADVAGNDAIGTAQLAEAIQYRRLDAAF